MGVRQGFAGVIGRDWRDSTPAWPPRAEAPPGAPNVVYLVLDDVGYAQLGRHGSIIDTPNVDALGGIGRPARQLPHRGAVLTHAVVPAHRPEPPFERDGPRRRPGDGLPRVRR